MSTGDYKFGVVGVGRGSAYGSILSSTKGCQVVACCDKSEKALSQFQEEFHLPDSCCFTNYTEFINSVPMDAVFLGTPIPAHADQAVYALESGIHVLSEVTAASSLADCERLVDAVKRSGKIYMMAENCCYWHFIRQWCEWVQLGRIGDVFYAECEYLHPIPDAIIDPVTSDYLWRAERPPIHYCSHSLGPILEITQDRIIRAMGLGRAHRIMPEHLVMGTIDIQVAMFETERGAIIKLLRSSMAPRPYMHYYMLQGTKGFLETDREGPQEARFFIQDEMESPKEIECLRSDPALPESAGAGGHGTSEYLVVQEFLQSLNSGKRPALDVVRSMDLTTPGIMAHESAMLGGIWLDVPLFAW